MSFGLMYVFHTWELTNDFCSLYLRNENFEKQLKKKRKLNAGKSSNTDTWGSLLNMTTGLFMILLRIMAARLNGELTSE